MADNLNSDQNAGWILGLCFQFGLGVDQDTAKANTMFNFAVKKEGVDSSTDSCCIALHLRDRIAGLKKSREKYKLLDFFKFFSTLHEPIQEKIRSNLHLYCSNDVARFIHGLSFPPGKKRDSILNYIFKYPTGRILIQSHCRFTLSTDWRAVQVDPNASYNLYLFYLSELDKKSALVWLKKAAEHGHIKAMYELAKIHSENWRSWVAQGIKKDISKAKDLYEKILAINPNDELAKKKLNQLQDQS